MNKKHQELVKKLLEHFYCPITLQYLHPKLALIGPDDYFYDSDVARELVKEPRNRRDDEEISDDDEDDEINPDDYTWKSPMTRMKYTCGRGSDCFSKPRALHDIFDTIQENHPDLIEDMEFDTSMFRIKDGTLIKYIGDETSVKIPNCLDMSAQH